MGSKIRIGITKDLINKIKAAPFIFFFLDYDGTLVPIKKRPSLATLPNTTRELLKTLSSKSWAELYIVSGRILKDVEGLVGLKSIGYVGNHGFELKAKGLKYINNKAEASKKAIAEFYGKLKRHLNIKGLITENKFYTLSIHYRLVKDKSLVEMLLKKIYNIAELYKGKIRLTKGKKVLEIRPNLNWNKGSMVNWILRHSRIKNVLPIFIGDDRTDEDAFRVLRKKGIGILVSNKKRPTYAGIRLKNPQEVHKLLKETLRVKA